MLVQKEPISAEFCEKFKTFDDGYKSYITIDGKRVPTRDYQRRAMDVAYEVFKYCSVSSPIESMGLEFQPAFLVFKAPQGGLFKIINKYPEGQDHGMTLQRDDGTEYHCDFNREAKTLEGPLRVTLIIHVFNFFIKFKKIN